MEISTFFRNINVFYRFPYNGIYGMPDIPGKSKILMTDIKIRIRIGSDRTSAGTRLLRRYSYLSTHI